MSFEPFRKKMEADGLSEAAIGAFERGYGLLLSGQSALIPESDIEPATDLTRYDAIANPRMISTMSMVSESVTRIP